MRFLIFLMLSILVYGSTYPFDWVLPPSSWQELLSDLLDTDKRTTYGDLIRNLIIFLPLGAIVAIELIEQHIEKESFENKTLEKLLAEFNWRFVLYYFVGCFWFAVILQFFQLFIESRVAAIGDAIVNVIGFTLGFFFTLLILLQQKHWLSSEQRSSPLPLVIAMSWLLYLVFPIYPVFFNFDKALSSLLDVIPNSFYVIPELVVCVLGWLFWIEFQCRYNYFNLKNFLILISVVLLTASSLEHFEWIYSIPLGAFIAWQLRNKQTHSKGLLQYRYWPTIILLMIVLTWLGLLDSLQSSRDQYVNWVPFKDWLRGNMMANIHFVLRQLFLYSCLIYCLSFARTKSWMKWCWCVATSLVIESAQYYLANGNFSFSEPILIALLAFGFLRVQTMEKISG